MIPSDVLSYRRMLHTFSREQISDMDALKNLLTGVDISSLRNTWRDCVKATHSDSEAYFVSDEMTALALEASKSMPRQTLLREDPPVPEGFLLYGLPVRQPTSDDDDLTATVQGFAWCHHTPHPYSDDAGQPVGVDEYISIHPLSAPNHRMYPPVLPVSSIDWSMLWRFGETPVNDDYGLGPLLLATWTLMKQTLTSSERATGDRAERRRCARSGMPLDVVVYYLRRKLTVREDSDETADVAWSHRWLVSGYWQNHYNPGAGTYRYMWISGHIKGPDHMPLVVKERVSAWIR